MLSRPAYIAAVAYVVFVVFILLGVDASSYHEHHKHHKHNKHHEHHHTQWHYFKQRLLTVILMFIPICISVYSINCFVKGKCVAWSYLHALCVVIWVLMFVLASVLSSQVQTLM